MIQVKEKKQCDVWLSVLLETVSSFYGASQSSSQVCRGKLQGRAYTNFVFHHESDEVPRFGSVEYNLYMISTNGHIDWWALIFRLTQH